METWVYCGEGEALHVRAVCLGRRHPLREEAKGSAPAARALER